MLQAAALRWSRRRLDRYSRAVLKFGNERLVSKRTCARRVPLNYWRSRITAGR